MHLLCPKADNPARVRTGLVAVEHQLRGLANSVQGSSLLRHPPAEVTARVEVPTGDPHLRVGPQAHRRGASEIVASRVTSVTLGVVNVAQISFALGATTRSGLDAGLRVGPRRLGAVLAAMAVLAGLAPKAAPPQVLVGRQVNLGRRGEQAGPPRVVAVPPRVVAGPPRVVAGRQGRHVAVVRQANLGLA